MKAADTQDGTDPPEQLNEKPGVPGTSGGPSIDLFERASWFSVMYEFSKTL